MTMTPFEQGMFLTQTLPIIVAIAVVGAIVIFVCKKKKE
jgi:hypothetical protein